MKKTIGAVALTAAVATGATGAGAIAAIPAAATVQASSATLNSAALASATARSQAIQPWPVLRQGQNAAWPKVTVRSLQYLLVARGAKVTVNGTFGATTKAAVVKFQRAHNLTADGVVGAKTWRALVVTVHKGSKGAAVRAVQDQINFRNNKNGHTLHVDGVFGPKTQAAVRAFQQAIAHEVRGFPVDGIVGPLTWQALVTEALSG